MGSSIGKIFNITTWGESHGPAIGVIIEGCPSGIKITSQEIQKELDRRRPNQSKITSQRNENDEIHILSGMQNNITLGTPIHMMIYNKDAQPKDYLSQKDVFRPSHADYSYTAKYGLHATSGAGRSSARETVSRVVAGALAKRILKIYWNVEILAWVESVANLKAVIDPELITLSQIESNIIRCPDQKIANKMVQLIEKQQIQGDSLGGIIGCIAKNVPAGWGEPVFDKLEADFAKALMSIPASKGFEIGSGFEGTLLTGKQHNDIFELNEKDQVKTKTNFSGGIQGGISNGMPILMKVAFKPTSTIMSPQKSINKNLEPVILENNGRHDPCVLPRAVPIVEAMVALVLVDHALRQQSVSFIMKDNIINEKR